MNCQECRDELAAYIEGLLDETRRSQMETHMAECSNCQTELQEVRELTARLARMSGATAGLSSSAEPPVSLENAVMDRILQEQAIQLRRLKMRKRMRMLGISGAMAAAAAMLFVGGFWLTQPAVAESKRAAQVLAQGAEATPSPSTVHIVAKMRTLPHDNFSVIGAEYDFVPVEIWRQFGDRPKWRVEKPGRVAAMDGESTTMLIRPDYVVMVPRVTQAAFDTDWLLALTRVQDMITHELRSAQARGLALKLTHETTAAGENMLVTVEMKSGLPANDYLKNKYFEGSDMRRVYRFDAKTKRLQGFDAYLLRSTGDVLILTIEQIEYDRPLDPTVFALKLPDRVSLYQEPERLPDNAKYERMTPKQAAQAFFEACEKKDWNEVGKFCPLLDEGLRSYLGSLKLVSLGEPFQSKAYPGWFVPYEVRFVKVKRAMKLSNDNPAKRYVMYFGAGPVREVKRLPNNEKYEKMTPKEVVQAFFDACEKENWDEAQQFLDSSLSRKDLQAHWRGVTRARVEIGEPVKTKDAGRWSVPFTIYRIQKHNLALRSDNPAKRYVVDGGI